jgi:methyl-galactoside transport system permease protein
MKIEIVEKIRSLEPTARRRYLSELLFNNSLYIFLFVAVVLIQFINPRFLSLPSIVNIVSLSAANLPIALGIAGAIILTGTDLSAGRIVGLVACISAALLQSTDYAGKMFKGLPTLPIPLVLLLVLLIGALVFRRRRY